VWANGAARGLLRTGTFYATAAIAFGRVYIGSTDGRMYSFSARDGDLAWAHQTGNYVYSSAAVMRVPRLGPTVYFGSYDSNFYALNARNGAVRWSHDSGGRISGSPTIVSDTVYFASLGRRRTFGLNIRTGRRVFGPMEGGYDPVVSDGTYLFLTGYRTLSALRPRRAGRDGDARDGAGGAATRSGRSGASRRQAARGTRRAARQRRAQRQSRERRAQRQARQRRAQRQSPERRAQRQSRERRTQRQARHRRAQRQARAQARRRRAQRQARERRARRAARERRSSGSR
jgi:hypothetical protein